MGSVASPSPLAYNYRQPTVESSMLGTPAFQSTLPLGQPRSLGKDERDDHEDINSEADFDIGDYNINLEKLGEKNDCAHIGHRKPQRPNVPSEVGGPEDFTLHLRDYINGVLPRKTEKEELEVAKDSNGQVVVPAAEGRAFATQNKQSQDESQNAPDDAGSEKEYYNREFSTPQQNRDLPNQHHRTMPPMSRHNTEGRLDEAADEIFDRISALQAEIEKLRIESEQTRASNQALAEQCSTIKDERSLLKGELSQVRHQVQEAEARESRAHERVMALERARSSNETKELESLRTRNESLISELAATRTEAQVQKGALNECIHDLKGELQKARDDLALRPELPCQPADSDTPALDREVSDLRSQIQTLEASATASRYELESTTSQLRDTRNWASALEEQNGRLAQQNMRMSQDNDKIANALEQKTAELSAAQNTLTELRETHHASEETPSPPTSKFRELQAEAVAQADAEHDDTLQALEKSHAVEVKKLKSSILKAGRGMQKREAWLVKEQTEEILALENQIKTLRSQVAQYETKVSLKSAPPVEESIANQYDKTSKLRAAARTISSLRAINAALEESVSGLQSEVKSLRVEGQDMAENVITDREDYKAVNKDFDAEVLAMVRERDTEWKSKIHKLKEENKLMGKTLLMMWGRQECGPGAGGKEGKKSVQGMPEKQRYIYRFKDNDKVHGA